MECKIIRGMLPAYEDGEMTEAGAKNVDDHLTVCPSCRKVYLELKDAWYTLGAWEDSDPPEKLRLEILSHIAKKRKMRWLRIVIPVAAALLIVVGLTFKFAGLQHEKQAQMTLPVAPIQLSAEHLDFDEDELVADLHVLQDEDFYDTVDELVKIDYLPLIDDTKQPDGDRERSSLDVALT